MVRQSGDDQLVVDMESALHGALLDIICVDSGRVHPGAHGDGERIGSHVVYGDGNVNVFVTGGMSEIVVVDARILRG
jgi:hypothetical protein